MGHYMVVNNGKPIVFEVDASINPNICERSFKCSLNPDLWQGIFERNVRLNLVRSVYFSLQKRKIFVRHIPKRKPLKNTKKEKKNNCKFIFNISFPKN